MVWVADAGVNDIQSEYDIIDEGGVRLPFADFLSKVKARNEINVEERVTMYWVDAEARKLSVRSNEDVDKFLASLKALEEAKANTKKKPKKGAPPNPHSIFLGIIVQSSAAATAASAATTPAAAPAEYPSQQQQPPNNKKLHRKKKQKRCSEPTTTQLLALIPALATKIYTISDLIKKA